MNRIGILEPSGDPAKALLLAIPAVQLKAWRKAERSGRDQPSHAVSRRPRFLECPAVSRLRAVSGAAKRALLPFWGRLSSGGQVPGGRSFAFGGREQAVGVHRLSGARTRRR